MAILDQTYQPWSGDFQPRYRRVAAMVRVGIRQTFAGTFVKIVVLCAYAFMFGWMGLLFILSTLRVPPPVALGNNIYRQYLGDLFPMGILVMTLAALVGSRAISRDLRNNAVSMYFSKAITRSDYLLGKWAIVAGFLLSATLAPAVCLWIGHWALARETLTTGQRLSDLFGIVKQSLVLVVPVAIYALALSAMTRNALVAGVLWVMTYLGSWLIGLTLQARVEQEWCKLVSWPNLVARAGELAYTKRAVKVAPLGAEIGSPGPAMEYGWGPILAILGAITLLSAVYILWRLRKFEGQE